MIAYREIAIRFIYVPRWAITVSYVYNLVMLNHWCQTIQWRIKSIFIGLVQGLCLMNPIRMPAAHTLFNMRSDSNLGIYFGKTLWYGFIWSYWFYLILGVKAIFVVFIFLKWALVFCILGYIMGFLSCWFFFYSRFLIVS